MKPTNVIDVQRTGSFGGDKVKMGIDVNSLAHIMSVLTDLYSNTVRACVREYSTNARDSHIDAGQSRPIEITLPNALSPFFKVKDFGLGLSVEDVHTVYSQYGASTKRDRDTVNGMLGLGCKSALTYATQFTVVSVKEGVKITVVVSRSEDGSAEMEIVDTVSTTEPNGVEITIPVKHGDANAFAAEVNEFFQYWDRGTVLVNGNEPTPIKETLDQITPEIGLLNGRGDDVVVFGGVAYPVKDNGLFPGNRPANNPYRLVAFLDASDDLHKVVFTPNREALTYSGLTMPTLERLRQEFQAAIVKSVQADVDACPSHYEAYKKFRTWEARFGAAMLAKVNYKGETFPEHFTFRYLTWQRTYGRRSVEAYYWKAGQQQKIGHESLANSLLVTNYDGVQITSVHKNKIKAWMDENGLTANLVVFAEGVPAQPWLKGERMVEWQVIKKFPLPGAGGPRNPRNPAFPVYDPSTGYSSQGIPLDKTKTLVYVSPRNNLRAGVIQNLYKAYPNIQIFCLGENRWDKFTRENPGAMSLYAWAQKVVTEARDNLTKDDMYNLQVGLYTHTYGYQYYQNVDASKIKDPALAKYIVAKQGKTDTIAMKRYRAAVDVARKVGYHDRDLPAVNEKVTENYPYLSDPSRGNELKHFYWYVNAVYAARQNGELV